MAFIALVGGLSLAYFQSRQPSPPPVKQKEAGPQLHIEQQTSGKQSPAVAGVEGNVSVSVTETAEKKNGEKTDAKTKK